MILKLKNIQLSFTDSRGEIFNLLDGVNLDVKRKTVTALVGGNGTGKTTLFNVISGFTDDFKGEILFDNLSLKGMAPHKISRLGIGRLFQGRQLIDNLSLMENMKIASVNRDGEDPLNALFRQGQYRRTERQKEEHAIEILEQIFGKDNKYLAMLDKKASELSYGEQRLIAIARLLMGNNKLLLLDEPTSGVNPVYIETIKGIIRKMVTENGLTVLLIEHNMHFVRDIADFCAYLDNGRIEKIGTTEEVLDDKEVRSSYLGS